MATFMQQSIEMHDGQYVVLPKWKGGEADVNRGLAIPDPYVFDTTQKYPVGTKFVDDDRRFHYGYINALGGAMTANRGMGGVMNAATYIAFTTSAVIEPVDETEISVVDAASTLNMWAGGYLMIRAHPVCYYRILSNTAAVAASVITLERGLLTATTSGATVWANQNMYSKMESHLPNANLRYASCVGICLPVAVAARWAWVQTWGPCYLSGGDELIGKSEDIREAYVYGDGTLQSPAAFHRKQRAGYALNQTSSNVSTWYIYLQLAC